MAGTKKETFLTILVFILLGAVIFESAMLLISISGQNITEGIFTGKGKQGLAKSGNASLTGLSQSEWNPFQEMMLLRERMNRMIDDTYNRGTMHPMFQSMNEGNAIYEPEVDITETEKQLIVRCDLPGMEKDRINVEVKNNYVTIKGIRNLSQETENTLSGIYRKERRFGTFAKTFMLPVPVDENHAKAGYQNGVLTIELPKLHPGPKQDKITALAIT